jgi:hypothetical protein
VLHGEHRLDVSTTGVFEDAFKLLASKRFDLLILDVFRGPVGQPGSTSDGRDVLAQIRSYQFLPVIFFTALPRAVDDLKSPVIKVVTKGGSAFDDLDSAVGQFLQSGLLNINRAFYEHVVTSLRDYLWEFLPTHWDAILAGGDPTTLAYVLCRRLAATLEGRGADALAAAIARKEIPEDEAKQAERLAHPMQFYILPPVAGDFCAGDILRKSDDATFWIVLTPTCDFVVRKGERKAEFVLLSPCRPIAESKEYKEWDPNTDEKKNLERMEGLLRNNPSGRQRDRFCFLPGTLVFPDLLIDFQQSKAVSFADLVTYVKLATLDSPFREGITLQYSRYVGRVGYPDLDTQAVLRRLAEGKGTDRGSPA